MNKERHICYSFMIKPNKVEKRFLPERAKKINPKAELHYVLPQEGTNIWFDMLMIPKGANNIDAAYQFLNFIMDPTISALNSNFLYQPSGSNDNKVYLQSLFNDQNKRLKYI